MNEALDWVRRKKIDLQQYCITHGERDKVVERESKVKQLISNLPKGQCLILKVIESSEAVLNSTGPEGQELINNEIEQLQADWQQLQYLCQESEKTLSDCILTWSQFTAVLENMHNWIDTFKIKLADEKVKDNKSSDDLARCKNLVDEAIRQKPTLEELNDKCEFLMEMSVCNWVRDKTVQIQSAYTAVLTEAQGLVSKVEKNLSDHTEYLKAKNDLEDWLQATQCIINGCMGVGDISWAKNALENTKVFLIINEIKFAFRNTGNLICKFFI